jgi:diguanylate cyclase (GGDEF)-like protein
MQNKIKDEQQTVVWLSEIIAVQAMLAAVTFNLDIFMNLVADKIMQLTQATGAVVELLDKNEMVYRAAVGSIKAFVGLRLSASNSISGLCVQLGEVLQSDDTELDHRVNKEACRRVFARSMIVAPLFHQGAATGVLKVVSSKPNQFHDQDVKTLQLMAGLIGAALAHQIAYDETEKLLKEKTKLLAKLKKSEEKLAHLASYDFLTDLPNRFLFTHTLETAILYAKRYEKKIAVFYMDVDHFKKINDTLGHDAGDALLKEVANRIKACVRESDTPSRFGGDEFVVLQNDVKNEDDVKVLAQKINHCMEQPFYLNNQPEKITISIGAAILTDKNTTSEMLISQADQALYDSKQSGRDRFTIYPMAQ